MIEVARALVESQCRLQFTVYFVAFDKEEVGSQGSHEFVRSFLVPTVFAGSDWPEFQVLQQRLHTIPTSHQGAIILDTIMNYNTTSGSQVMADSWISKTGATEEKEARGDFISLVSRRGPDKVRRRQTI